MKLLNTFTYILMPLIIIILATFIMASFQPFYYYEFKKNNIYSIVDLPSEAIPETIDRLSGYVIGRYHTLNHKAVIKGQKVDVYGEREILHMIDVRKIFDILKIIAITSAIFTMLLGAYHKRKNGLLNYLTTLSQAGFIGIVIIVLFISSLVLLDFNKYFIVFHKIFFSNDLWLLNPQTDVLIQMLPQAFFMDMALAIIVLALVIAIAFWGVVKVVGRRR